MSQRNVRAGDADDDGTESEVCAGVCVKAQRLFNQQHAERHAAEPGLSAKPGGVRCGRGTPCPEVVST